MSSGEGADPVNRASLEVGVAGGVYRRRSRGRPLAWGLGISAFLHLLFLLFASRTWIPVRLHSGGAEPTARPARATLPEMQALRLQIRDDAAPLTPEEVPDIPERERIPPRRAPTAVEPQAPIMQPRDGVVRDAERESTASPTRSPVDRLQPELVDPRLWERAGAPPEPEKSDFERAKERVYARIEMLNDSLAAEGEAERRATDWTFTDKDGKKWGISPGMPPKVHLGGKTVPLPFGFSPPPDQAKEARDRSRKLGEIRDHADRARVRGTFDEQVKATRAERDRSRSAPKDSTTTGGT